MLNSQIYFLKNHLMSKWNKSPLWTTNTIDDISFLESDNSINSIITDLSVILDKWIFIESTNESSLNQGSFKISSVSINKIILDSSFRVVTDELAGEFITIIPLICPIKFNGVSFAYPNKENDFFVEYSLNTGYSKAVSGLLSHSGCRYRSEGWIKFLFHSPTFYGENIILPSLQKLRSIFRIGNLGESIRICSFEASSMYKDDQKDYMVTPCIVEIKADYDERSLNEELTIPYTSPGFNYMNMTIDESNTFVKFSAVHLNTTSGNYELTTMNVSDVASQIVIDCTSSKFIIQNSGPIKFSSGHGLPVGKIAYLATPISSLHPNITFTEPVSGKVQKLFEVVDSFQISISIGAVNVI